ncbi:MAG: IS1634 family transposase [Verrucomicrobia bacterium]|nr:IS1634 family transposase [Verrucomicrobiota bacterium]
MKRRVRHKDGKDHIYYSVCESLRIHKGRTVQRQILHLGELNTRQEQSWQHTIDVINEDDGQLLQRRLFADREGTAPCAGDVIEVRLSTLRVRQPRRFGDCWAATHLWRQLGLDAFWQEKLGSERGGVPWAKVLELLCVNRLLDPRSELYVHEKWFPQTAMDILLDCDQSVADISRLYRCLDHLADHKQALEQHLAAKWKDLFGADFDIVLYDLTSTYFEGKAQAVPKARRGYSRDHRPDCKQLVIALVVTADGFPLTYEIFNGNTIDVTTLQHIVQTVETKHGRARRVWVFDRGINSEANLEWLRQRGACYLVGTPKSQLGAFEQKLTEGDWLRAAPEVEVKLCPADNDLYVLCRSQGRIQKEQAMRRRAIKALIRDLIKLRNLIAKGKLKNAKTIDRRIAHLEERHRPCWRFLNHCACENGRLQWQWDKAKWQASVNRDGAYLLRAHWPGCSNDPAQLWQTYVQLTEAEAAFRTLKSDIKVRPIWHQLEARVEAHIMIAFLGYAMHVCLKKLAVPKAPSLTPWQILQHLRKIVMVDVEFETRDGRTLILPRITIPEQEQAALLLQLGWTLPQQPPPRIRGNHLPGSN